MNAEHTGQPADQPAGPRPTDGRPDTGAFGALATAFERLDAAARADSTVGTPRQLGERTLVPLAEVYYGGGFGLGGGSTPEAAGEERSGPGGSGLGGGGGFGGRLRPVAVVEVGPDGARVRPVVDVTLLGLALAGLALAAVLRWPWRRRD